MRDKIVNGQCIGDVRLCGIDVGFDLRAINMPVVLADVDDRELIEGGVGYDGRDGRKHLMHGTLDEVARQLARNGYCVVAALTPTGREVRCEPRNPDVFVCQAPDDNHWLEFPSIAAALAQFG